MEGLAPRMVSSVFRGGMPLSLGLEKKKAIWGYRNVYRKKGAGNFALIKASIFFGK